MDIQTEKIELVKLLLNTEDEAIIYSVKQILMHHQHDFWKDLSQEQQKEIEAADLEIERGETVDYEAFMANQRS
ncbi:MAG: hypothetical protein EOP42_23265 [Sphingobacteriaceae bacterium]|nr:MAG: hypothetical protein EOP42_23265 [Sphingobacteriaceae bacterium]